jgi:F-type H+-transporting ATPase subunit a
MSALHISISAEKVAQLGPLVVSNSLLTSVVATTLILAFCYSANQAMRKNAYSRFQMLVELIIESLFTLCRDIAGTAKKAKEFAPIIITFFLFIIMNNWLGLIPGVGTIGTRASGEFVPFFRAGTADLNTTLALALISVVLTQYYGFKHLKAGYLKKYLNFSSPIMFFVGLLETVLEFAKIMSFAFRLFGNIFAGEVLLAVMMFLVPLIVPMPFYGLELFVGFIQALVFSMLSLVFFNLATMGHEEEHG